MWTCVNSKHSSNVWGMNARYFYGGLSPLPSVTFLSRIFVSVPKETLISPNSKISTNTHLELIFRYLDYHSYFGQLGIPLDLKICTNDVVHSVCNIICMKAFLGETRKGSSVLCMREMKS